jgi:hypothetical protein
MAKDFSAKQIRTNTLIASGGLTGEGGIKGVSLAIYSASIASDFQGGHTADAGLFSDVGKDVFLFVSGSKDSRGDGTFGSNGDRGVTLFGGDVVVSGTFYAERMVVEVDEFTTGSVMISGSLIVSRSATIYQGLTVNAEAEGSAHSDFVTYADAVVADKLVTGDGIPLLHVKPERNTVSIGTALPSYDGNKGPRLNVSSSIVVSEHRKPFSATSRVDKSGDLQFRKSRGTYDSTTKLELDDEVGKVSFWGHDFSAVDQYNRGAAIIAKADATPTVSGEFGARIELSTAPIDGGDIEPRLTVTNSGMILIASGTSAAGGLPPKVAPAPNEATYTDTILFVSGTAGSRGSSTVAGTTTIAGDLAVSGALYMGLGGSSDLIVTASLFEIGWDPNTITNAEGPVIRLSSHDAIVDSSTVLGKVQFHGYDDDIKNRTGAEIKVQSSQAWSATGGANILFSTLGLDSGNMYIPLPRMIITSEGLVGVGKDIDASPDITHALFVSGTAGIAIEDNTVANTPDTVSSKVSLRRSRGTRSSLVVAEKNDILGTVNFESYNPTGGAFGGAAQIVAIQDGTPTGANDFPGRISIRTRPMASAMYERLVIKSDGTILINSGGIAGPDASGRSEETYADTIFFVSGTVGSRGTDNKGTSVFGGDVFTSGTLYASKSFYVGQTGFMSSSEGSFVISNTEENGNIYFKINDGGTDKTVMQIDGERGKVGIGLTEGQTLSSIDGTLIVSNSIDNSPKFVIAGESPTIAVRAAADASGIYSAIMNSFQKDTSEVSRIYYLSGTSASPLFRDTGAPGAILFTDVMEAGTHYGIRAEQPSKDATWWNHDKWLLYASTSNYLKENQEAYSDNQILILSSSGPKAPLGATATRSGKSSPDPLTFTDTNFWVSGSIGKRGGPDKHVAVFGGDLHVSGNLTLEGGGFGWVDDGTVVRLDTSTDSVGIGTDLPKAKLGVTAATATILVDAAAASSASIAFSKAGAQTAAALVLDGQENLALVHSGANKSILIRTDGGVNYLSAHQDIAGSQVLILSGGAPTHPDESVYTDLAFFVSGSIGNKNSTNRKGTSVFGGDVVISGTLHGGSPLSIGSGVDVTGSMTVGGSLILSGDTKTFITGAMDMTGSMSLTGSLEVSGSLTVSGSSTLTVYGPAVFNEGGSSDSDFRVETKNKAAAFVVNSATDKIGFSSTGPKSDIQFGNGVASFTTLFDTATNSSSSVAFNRQGGPTLGAVVFEGSSRRLAIVNSGSERAIVFKTTKTGESVPEESVLIAQSTDGQHIQFFGGTSSTDAAFSVSGSFANATGVNPDRGAAVFGGNMFISGALLVSGAMRNGIAHTGGTISGSIHQTHDGLAYLEAGENITIVSSSNGQIRITSTGGGSAGGNEGWIAPANEIITTTGSLFIGTPTSANPDIEFNSDGSAYFNKQQLNGPGDIFRVSTEGRLGAIQAVYATDTVFILSGGAGSSLNPNNFTDLSFFVSGAIGSKGTGTKGTSVFGGDVVISGSLNGGSPLQIGSHRTDLGSDIRDLFVGNTGGNSTVVFDGDVLSSGSITSMNTLSGSLVKGNYLTGSLTRMADGRSYIQAGANVTVVSASDGAITISSTGGGSIDGAGAATRLAYWADSDTLMSNSGLHFNEFTLGLTGSASGATSALDLHRIYSNTAGNSSITSHAGASGILIDYDVTSAVASGQFQKHKGLWVKYDSSSPTMVGMAQGAGIEIEMTGSNSGVSQTIDGISINVTNTAGSFTNSATRGIMITAPAGTVAGEVNASHIRCISQVDTADYFDISVGTHGITQLTTKDAAAANGHLNLKPDGKVLILSGGAATSRDEATYADTCFFVSGTIGSRGTAAAGTSVFGGDLVVSGALALNQSAAAGSQVFVTTGGRVGIGTPSPSYKLEVGGSMAIGEYIYHRNDADTHIRLEDDKLTLTAGNETLLTLTEDTQDIVTVGDGGDVDFEVKSAADHVDGDHPALHLQGNTGRLGLGTNSPTSILHIEDSAPTVTIQREDNANSSTLQFVGQAGATANMVHLATSNDLVFSTHDGSDQEEILRLGGYQTSDLRQVILLSGSAMADSAMHPKESTDINFFVSGAIGSRNTATKGTSVFGGDVVISGSLNGGSPLQIGAFRGDLGTDVKDLFVSNTGGNSKALFDGDVFSSGSIEVMNSVKASLGLSGSLTTLMDGTSYIHAGANVTVTSASNGSITISSTGGGGASPWTDAGVVIHPTDSGDAVAIGGTNAGNAHIYFSESGAAVFNEQAGDQNFRVETNGNQHSLFIDSNGNDPDYFMIGQATPHGTDCWLSVSGSIGRKNIPEASISCFGGDLAISGTAYLSTTTLQSNIQASDFTYSNAQGSVLLIDTMGGSVTASLPSAADAGQGRLLIVRDLGGFAGNSGKGIMIKPSAGQKFDGNTGGGKILINSGSMSILSDGLDNWLIVGTN